MAEEKNNIKRKMNGNEFKQYLGEHVKVMLRGSMPIVVEGILISIGDKYLHLGYNPEEIKKSVKEEDIVFLETFDEYDEMLEDMELHVIN